MKCSQLLKEALDDPRFKYVNSSGPVSVGSFNGKMVLVEEWNNGKFTVDTSNFTSGSGDGKQFYNMIWDWADKNNMKYDIIPESLSTVNKYRLAANILDRFNNVPSTKAINKIEANKLIKEAIKEVNLDLRFDGANKTIGELTEDEIIKYGKIFGEDSSKRLGYKSLTALKDFSNGKITLPILLGILVEGEQDGNY